ncbi:flagellar basal-body rod protein FlgF [Roseospirillum parvum]|uniref:Flagellar basal-body rod protein FlgF n=1 Tax=Roseospirillum parvum TaxID=83401 RepID=A0A1G8FFY1_9PROT|nr:flagellar basal-body rod protein FlgF [Roseospirillum parvum]SDH80986.1 flagellar basal-body rod protein FlgF [Roseospirillum parvum]
MENTSYIALSQQSATWRQMAVTANNVANMNTPGFKAEHALFTDYLVKVRNDDRTMRETLHFVQDYGVMTDTREGPVRSTGNPLDLAVSGNGYFTVATEDGDRYTRNGRFQLDVDGQIVNSEGLPVLSQNGTPFFIAPGETKITVAGDGTISTENGELGRLGIVDFTDPQTLTKEPGGLFRPGENPEDQPQEVERPAIVQGALEGSNVNGVVEMTRLIELQRHYSNVQKMIDTEHERIRRAMQTYVGNSQ